MDRGHEAYGVIDKFSASGVYISQITVAAGSNPPIGQLNGVAVDANGTVWVQGNQVEGDLYEFNDASTNEYVSKVHVEFENKQPVPGVFGLAIGSEGNFYIGRKFLVESSQYLAEFLSGG